MVLRGPNYSARSYEGHSIRKVSTHAHGYFHGELLDNEHHMFQLCIPLDATEVPLPHK
jgi:hypothetical protein